MSAWKRWIPHYILMVEVYCFLHFFHLFVCTKNRIYHAPTFTFILGMHLKLETYLGLICSVGLGHRLSHQLIYPTCEHKAQLSSVRCIGSIFHVEVPMKSEIEFSMPSVSGPTIAKQCRYLQWHFKSLSKKKNYCWWLILNSESCKNVASSKCFPDIYDCCHECTGSIY